MKITPEIINNLIEEYVYENCDSAINSNNIKKMMPIQEGEKELKIETSSIYISFDKAHLEDDMNNRIVEQVKIVLKELFGELKGYIFGYDKDYTTIDILPHISNIKIRINFGKIKIK